MRGLIIDNFAGGGGASTGIEMAIGRSVDIAINHDPDAIAMHTVNHPNTLHYCESVFDVDPLQATAGHPVDLVWLSPDCKHFSKAKGGKPVSKQIRGLAWIAVRWALKVRPKVMYLENVEEFQTWGPLVTDQSGNYYPCKERKGETFKAFVSMLTTGIAADHPALAECCEVLGISDPAPLIKGLGYTVDWQERRACDSGAATIRKRLYMVMRCDGRPIVFPEPTHGPADSPEVKRGLRKKYKVAADIINWSIPCPSIFDRPKELVIATKRRLAKGVQRFVINTENPFIVDKQITPFITEHANASNQRNMPADEPLRTICAQVKGGHFAVVAPVIARQFGNSVGHKVDEPLGTITAGGGGKSNMVAACLAKHYGGNYQGAGADLRDPLPTITTVDHNAVVAASIIKFRGENVGSPATQPIHTISAGGLHHGVVATSMAKCGRTDPDPQKLFACSIAKYNGTNIGQPIHDPLQTITTKHRFAHVESEVQSQPLTERQRLDAWWCARFIDMYGENIPDYEFIGYRPAMITVSGGYVVTDIGQRMLAARELFDATAFPEDYQIEFDQDGKKIPVVKQVARVGNAVSPVEACALVRANQPELCISNQEAA